MVLASPTPAAFSPLIYSAAASKLVLINESNFPAYLEDTLQTFTWNGSAWTLANSGLANNPTPLRSDTSAAYDTTGSQVVMFGGRGQPGQDFCNDLWGYASGTWSNLEPNYNSIGLSIGTITTSLNTSTYPNTVVQSNINGTVGLCIRAKSYMFGLSTGVLLHGGFDRRWTFNDSYLWASGSWSTLSPANIPPVRVGACAASNGTNQGILCFGANESTLLGDVWAFSTSGNTWTQLTVNTGSGAPCWRKDAAFAYYPIGGYYLMFSGSDSSGNLLSDTWKLTVSGGTGTWVNLTPSNSPSNRIGMSLAYDTASSQMIGFGGKDSKNLLGDTVQWNGTTWVNLFNPISTY